MNTENKIINDLNSLKELRQSWKEDNLKVVFTNGCFDIVHLGHIDYLEKARNLGQKLIIGLNTDESIKTLKGESRPINDAYARARMLAAFQFVDAVILFGEETPFNLINSLLPDVLVKGNDYTIDTIVGAKEVLANGGKVETVELVAGYSTSNIINKIKGE
ncbi:D-glycero-beta-D-manno-heptose 1-phosphate adenylyltransferase [Sediminitomix flava]|uniref:D-glycero-beta-D-manno-heptose 1-phosphate adenylyltransferase n=1 Tax=Sediminitomix flava TaxID=379075 RepID=A0A315ZXH3_SEDFL|nr:D-glycero-beta-D-manno-heptose 1-phosphate adenylyltransferase [Sediminitomix flava]PWJ42047.1 rfaE bifunctional protein nucleotidyltransferase chain/domain [Sediminitomix flava]